MRFKVLLPLCLGAMFLAGCAFDDNTKETGITRNTAITIAERHCAEYPDTYDTVDHAEWDADGKYWAVALTNDPGNKGEAFKIDRSGGIISTHKIDRGDESDYGPRHYGYGFGWY